MQEAHAGFGEKERDGQICLVLLVGKLLNDVIQWRFSRLIDRVEFLAQSVHRLTTNPQLQAEIFCRAVFVDHYTQLRQYAQQRRPVSGDGCKLFLNLFGIFMYFVCFNG